MLVRCRMEMLTCQKTVLSITLSPHITFSAPANIDVFDAENQ